MFDYYDGIFPVCRLVEAYQPVLVGGRIKRPTNSFLLFRTWQTKLRKFKEQEGRSSSRVINQTQVSGEMSALWKNIPEEVRAYFDQLADELAKEHRKVYPHYMFCPRKKDKEGARPHTDITKRKKKEKNKRGDVEEGGAPKNTALLREESTIPSAWPVNIQEQQVSEPTTFSMQQQYVGGMASSASFPYMLQPIEAPGPVLPSTSGLQNSQNCNGDFYPFNFHPWLPQQDITFAPLQSGSGAPEYQPSSLEVDSNFGQGSWPPFNQQQDPSDIYLFNTNFALPSFSPSTYSPLESGEESSSSESPALNTELFMPTAEPPLVTEAFEVPQRPRSPFRRNIETSPAFGSMYYQE